MKLKKLLSIILAATMLLTTVQISFAFLLSAENEIIYYVAENGNDANDGLTEGAALATINKAQELIAAKDTETAGQDGKIIVIGTAEFDGGVAHKGMITIAEKDDSSQLKYKSTQLTNSKGSKVSATVIKGPTTFDGVTLPNKSMNGGSQIQLVSGGYEMVFKNLSGHSSLREYTVGQVDSTPAGTREKVTFETISGSSGASNEIFIGAMSNTNTVSGGLDLTVSNGRIFRISLYNGNTYTGNVNIVLNYFSKRDSSTKTAFKNDVPTINGAFQMIINRGRLNQFSDSAVTAMNGVVAAGGTWIMRCEEDTNKTLLGTTADAGKFTVSGSMVAKAYKVTDGVAAETSTASSKNGILDLSAHPGVYNVKFSQLSASENSDTIVYVSANGSDENDGTEISPFATIDYAQTWLNKSIAEGEKTIMVKGTADFDGGEAHDDMMIIKGCDENASLNLIKSKYTPAYSSDQKDGVLLQGPTTFDNIHLSGPVVNNGHKIVYQNMPNDESLTTTYTHMFGNTSGRQEIVFNDTIGGINTPHVLWFAADKTSKQMDGIDFEANGAQTTFNGFMLRSTTFKGDVNFVFNNFRAMAGTEGVSFSNYNNSCTFEGAFQFIANNGTYANFKDDAKTNISAITATKGSWIITGAEGGTLTTTETAGTFKVVGEKICRAVNKATGEITDSQLGILTIPAGVYEVTYVDPEEDIDGPYPNANEELNDTEGDVRQYIIYVASESEGGSNRYGNGTKEHPYRTIDKAMYEIASIPKVPGVIKKGIIYIKGEVEFDGGEPHVNMITISAEPNATVAALKYVTSSVVTSDSTTAKDGVILQGPTTFDGVYLPNKTDCGNKNVYLISGGHKVVYNNTSIPSSDQKARYYYVGQGDSTPTGTRENVTFETIAGGVWTPNYIYIGAASGTNTVSAGVDLTINAGRLREINLAKGTTYNGNVNITINDFSRYAQDKKNYAKFVDNEPTINGGFQFIVNNDRIGQIGSDMLTKIADVKATEGAWLMAAATGGSLATTDTAGKFAVSSGVMATAVNRETKVPYTSEGGFLTVPAGVYDVTFEESIDKAVYIDAMTAGTETVGQKVRLENGKTYKFSFSYRNIENGLGNNVDVAVYSGKNILYSSALTGAKNIKLASEANDTYSRVYEFTFGGTTGDYEVGFAIKGSTLMRVYNPKLVESNSTVNLYKNAIVKKNLENWIVSSQPAAADATEHTYTQGDTYVTIKTGDYYLTDYRKVSSAAKALHIKSDGQFAIGTNVKLKANTTYRLAIDRKDIETDFYYDSYVVVRGAYGTNDINEPIKTTNNNGSKSTLKRVEIDAEMARTVYEFSITSDGTYGVGVRIHNTAGTNHLTEFFETYIGNIALYDIGNPTVNLLKNSDFSNNLNGWYVAEHVEVEGDSAHKLTATTDIKLDPAATGYGNPATDRDYIELVSADKNFFKAPKGDIAGPKKMVHIQNGASWTEFFTIFKEENKLKANHTYVASFSISSDYDFDLDIRHTGNRTKLFESSVKPISKEEIAGDGYSYRILTFEFTVPEIGYKDVPLGSEMYIGINMSASKAAWLFDFNLYDKADPRKTNLMPNPEFRSNLDNWIWGWKARFEARSLGFGWTSWPAAGDTEQTSKLDIAPYDFKNLVSYKDDAYYKDGEWWDEDDVVILEAQELQGAVSGTIVDDKGNPLKNITAELKSASDSSIVYTAKTDAKGFFEIDKVAADVYTLTIVSEDGSRRDISEYITVSDSEIVTLNIKVAPAEIIVDSTTAKKSTIKGTLYNAKRETLSGVTVGVARNKTVVTDENGNFEFENLPAGKYKIFAVNPDGSYYLLRDYELGEGQEVTFKLKYDPEADKATNQNASTDNSQDSDADNESGFPWWIFIVIGAVLILGAAAVIVIILLKKKKSESQTA